MASLEDVGRALETLGRALKPQPNQCSAFIKRKFHGRSWTREEKERRDAEPSVQCKGHCVAGSELCFVHEALRMRILAGRVAKA
jgi:hypothetical protein